MRKTVSFQWNDQTIEVERMTLDQLEAYLDIQERLEATPSPAERVRMIRKMLDSLNCPSNVSADLSPIDMEACVVKLQLAQLGGVDEGNPKAAGATPGPTSGGSAPS